MKFIHTDHAPKAIGPYSQAVLVGDTLYISGQLPLDAISMTMPKSIKEQTQKSLDNILAILNEAGMDKNDIVRCGVFLKDLNHFSEMNDVYQAFFQDHKPARAAIEAARLPKDALIEIDAIAIKSKK